MFNVLRLAPLFLVFPLAATAAALEPVPSAVFAWDEGQPVATATGEIRPLIHGSALDLSELTVEGVTLNKGCAQKYDAAGNDEVLIIVKSGVLKAGLGEQTKLLSKGGVAYLVNGDSIKVAVEGDAPSTFYLFRYSGIAPADHARGVAAGGSILLPWDEVNYEPSDRGGYRQQFRRPTGLFDTFEMHTTTMIPGLINHEVHTHHAEELVLMTSSNVQMQIDGKTIYAKEGDLMFLGADVPHGLLSDLGTEPTEYFAFQWWK